MIKKVIIVIIFIIIGLIIDKNYNYIFLESSENYENTTKYYANTVEHREFCGDFGNTPEKSITDIMSENTILIILFISTILLVLKNYKYLNFNSTKYSDELLSKRESIINKIIFIIISLLIILLLLKDCKYFIADSSKDNITYNEYSVPHRELDGCETSSKNSSNSLIISVSFIIFIVFVIFLFLKKRNYLKLKSSQNIALGEIKIDDSKQLNIESKENTNSSDTVEK